MTIRIGINGLGRIGRCVVRALFEQPEFADIELVALNGSAANEVHAHLLQYDSVHGRFTKTVEATPNGLRIDGKEIPVMHERAISALDWKRYGADIVLECTGAFTKLDDAGQHLNVGAKKVLISAPAKDAAPTYVHGVNCAKLKADEHVFSIGSCTTNCLAPVAKVLNDAFGIEQGFMTTIHAYTGDQNLVDGSHKDMRRARAAGLSMVPTSTGAAKALGLVLPELAGKLDGTAVRVPTPNVSMVDLTFTSVKPLSKEAIHTAIETAASGAMKNVLAVNHAPLVSIDFTHNPASSIFDATGTQVMGSHFARVAAWYDNEWGFSCRMLDMARVAAKHC